MDGIDRYLNYKFVVTRSLLLFYGAALISACTPNADRSADEVFPKATNECEESAVPNQYIVRWKSGHLSIERSSSRQELMKNLVEPNLNLIETVQQDQYINVVPSSSTDETLPPENDWGVDAVHAPEVWAEGIYGDGVIVAVTDSGLDREHLYLQNRVYSNPNEIADNGIDDDNNGYVDDVSGWDFVRNSPEVIDTLGHGTHVTGIIATNHGKGPLRGIAPNVQILPLDTLDDNGGGTLGTALTAIEYAILQGAQVINASWGGSPCVPEFHKTMMKLDQEGVLFVTSAGNEYTNLDIYPAYPAALGLSHQITVGASTIHNFTAYFSNFGQKTVHLLAPGKDIISTLPQDKTLVLSGTSMATPFVSGAAALLLSLPEIKKIPPVERIRLVKESILNSVDQGNYQVLTRGRLNIAKALISLRQALNTPETNMQN